MSKKSKAGGYREGAGRPRGTGKYGERTLPLRVPVSLIAEVEELLALRAEQSVADSTHVVPYPNKHRNFNLPIPLYGTRVAAGSPSPGDDYIERHLDLNEHLVDRPSETFFVRTIGDSMLNAGIHENDILVVDRSVPHTDGKIVIAVLNSELTVKRLELKKGAVRLLPENPRYKPIEITEEMDFRILGVVVHVIHSL